MSEQREMELDEYLESKLPGCHLARQQLNGLIKEKDALAAHVRRWHDVYVDLTNSLMMLDGVAHYVANNAMMRRFDEIDESSPTTSLAHLKAEWQAEALDEAAMDIRANYGHHTQYSTSLLASAIDGMADSYRRQAEGE